MIHKIEGNLPNSIIRLLLKKRLIIISPLFTLEGENMLQELIDTFEEVKKYVYIIDRGENQEPLIIRFRNEHFYQLIGLHKMNVEMFFPLN